MRTLKQKLRKGWNFTRVIYTLVGSALLIQAVMQHDWLWGVMGTYLALMGVFALGCAAGNGCAGSWESGEKTDGSVTGEITYEEIKTK